MPLTEHTILVYILIDERKLGTMLQKIREALTRFMQGRYGADALGRFLVWAALAFYVLGMFVPHAGVLTLLGLATLIYTLFRMFSRNTARRTAENAWFWNKTSKLRTSFSQARVRFKNRKEYKYFRCPKCHAWLKLKRGAGEGTLTCGKCKHAFKAKA